MRRIEPPPRSVLMALTGLTIGGGIASVSRCMALSLDAEQDRGRLSRVDRVLLLDEPPGPEAPARPARQRLARGSQLRFAGQLWASIARASPEFILFDHVGLARAVFPSLPLPRPRYAVFVHWGELRYFSRAQKAALSGASLVLANSSFTADWVSRRLPSLSDRIHVIPLCVEPERVSTWAARQPHGSGSEERKQAALIVGRMSREEPGKGHDALIDGWSLVRERAPQAELWVVGAGDDVERLKKKATDTGQGSAIRFLGAVSDAELSRLYRTAYVYAMPSRQEGFGLTYLEAMWHGLPCVASDADAASNVVDATCGTLVPYGDPNAVADAIATMLENPERARAMGEAGRQRATREFSFERFRAHFLEALGLA